MLPSRPGTAATTRRRRRVVAAASALLVAVSSPLLAPATTASAASTIDQAWEPADPARGFASESVAQSFTAGRSGAMDRVDVRFTGIPEAPGASDPVRVELTDASGVVLGRGTLPATESGWATTSLEPAAPMRAGSSYVLRLTATNASFLTLSHEPGYGGGTMLLSEGSPYPTDLLFRTYVDPLLSQPAIVQQPATTLIRGDRVVDAFVATGSPPATFTMTGTLPNGVTLGADGTLQGTPTQTGTYVVAVTASNGVGVPATVTTTIAVRDAALPSAPRNVVVTRPAVDTAVIDWESPESFGDGTLECYVVLVDGRGGCAAAPLSLVGVTDSHVVTIAARTQRGTGPAASVTISPVEPPSAPQALTATPEHGAVQLAWQAPASDGGSAVTGYAVRHRVGDGAWSEPTIVDASTRSLRVGDLDDGTSYAFEVTARNGAGTSPSASATAAPRTVPGAPTSITARAGDGELNVSWRPPSDDGGAAIERVVVELQAGDGAWATPDRHGVGTDAVAIAGLVNGTSYRVRVAAVNAAGQGPWATSPSVTPRRSPGAPTSATASGADGRIEVRWEAPTTDGGAPVTRYVVLHHALPLGPVREIEVEADARSATLDGLENGSTYEVQVYAVNAAGWSPPASASATPATTADAPTGLVSTRGFGSATLRWDAPARTGGLPVVGYEIQIVAPGGSWMTPSDVAIVGTSATIGGLASGSEHSAHVRAITAAGPGAWSTSMTVRARATPGEPMDLVALAGDGEASIGWHAPDDDGGDPVVRYLVDRRTSTGDWVRIAELGGTDDAPGLIVADLENGTTAVFRVSAVNGVGVGPASEVAVTPLAAPAAPGLAEPRVHDRTVELRWSAPTSTGGSPITGYALEYAYGEGAWRSIGGIPASATGWTLRDVPAGTIVRVRVAAENAVGRGTWSGTGIAIVIAAPGAPSDLVATAGDGEIGLSWALPPADPLAPAAAIVIEMRTSTTAPWRQVAPGAFGTSVRINDLDNGIAYDLRIATTNEAGTSAWVEVAGVTPRTTPGAVRTLVADPLDGAASLAWDAPESDGGAAITGYAIEQRLVGGEWAAAADVTLDGLQAIVGGLDDGTPYELQVAAINPAGRGPWSDVVVVTPRTTPSAPGDVAATPRDGAATLAWTAPSDGGAAITGYVVELRGDDDAWELVEDATIDGTTAHVGGLPNGERVALRVAAVNAAGRGPWSDAITTTPFVAAFTARGPDGLDLAGAVLHPGDAIAVDAERLPTGATLRIAMHSDVVELGTTIVDADGRLAATVVLPADVDLGAHELWLALDGTGTVVDPVVIPFSVAAPPIAPTPSQPVASASTAPRPSAHHDLPRTGTAADGAQPAMLAALLIGAGVLLLWRRRIRTMPRPRRAAR